MAKIGALLGYGTQTDIDKEFSKFQELGLNCCQLSVWDVENMFTPAMETVTDFIFLGSKITADGDCSHEIKRHLFTPWKKNYDQPRQHIKKQRHFCQQRSI